MRHTGPKEMPKHDVYIQGHTLRIRNIHTHTEYMYILCSRSSDMDTDMGTSMVMCAVDALPPALLLLPCQYQMCYLPHLSPPLLYSPRGQLENLNRRKCCKLCRQHFSLAAKKRGSQPARFGLYFNRYIFGHTRTNTHMRCLTTYTHTVCICFCMGYTSIR